MSKRIITICDCMIMILLSIHAVLFCIPTLLGIKPVNVLSGSMEPYIQTGSIAYVKAMDLDKIHQDDVIAFELDNGSLVLHLVKEISLENEITTQGDANDNEDFATVSKDQLRGKMIFQIPNAGTVYQKVTKPAVCFALLIYAGFTIVYKLVSSRQETTESAEDDTEDIRLLRGRENLLRFFYLNI